MLGILKWPSSVTNAALLNGAAVVPGGAAPETSKNSTGGDRPSLSLQHTGSLIASKDATVSPTAGKMRSESSVDKPPPDPFQETEIYNEVGRRKTSKPVFRPPGTTPNRVRILKSPDGFRIPDSSSAHAKLSYHPDECSFTKGLPKKLSKLSRSCPNLRTMSSFATLSPLSPIHKSSACVTPMASSRLLTAGSHNAGGSETGAFSQRSRPKSRKSVKELPKIIVGRPKLPRAIGSLSIITDTKSTANNLMDSLSSTSMKKMSSENRVKMKWQTVKLLTESQDLQQAVTQLVKLFANQGEMDRHVFGQCMSYVGIADSDLLDKLFWIFDEDGSGSVDYKELVMSLSFFQSTSLRDKLESFFQVCDENGDGVIDNDEMYKMLKINVVSQEDKRLLREAVEHAYTGRTGFNKEEFLHLAQTNDSIMYIVEKNAKRLLHVDKWIDAGLNSPIESHGWTKKQRTRGVWHPFHDRLARAFGDKQRLLDSKENLKAFAAMLSRRSEDQEEVDPLAN